MAVVVDRENHSYLEAGQVQGLWLCLPGVQWARQGAA